MVNHVEVGPPELEDRKISQCCSHGTLPHVGKFMQAHLRATSKSNILRLLTLKQQIPLYTPICPHKTKRPKAQCHYFTKKTTFFMGPGTRTEPCPTPPRTRLAGSGKPNIEQQ